MMSSNQTGTANRISTFLLMIVLAVLALSVIALIFGAQAYLTGNDTVALYLFAILALNLSNESFDIPKG